MANADRKQKRDEFRREETALRALLKEWDPIPGSPEDEYDCLVHNLLSHLHRGATREELPKLIDEHSTHHFGTMPSSSEVAVVAAHVWRWWCKNSESGERDA
jgi:hypothetical protein